MIQKRKTQYKLFYYFLAVLPQLSAVLFSYSLTLNILATIRQTDDGNTGYFLAVGLAVVWIILFFLLKMQGTFTRFGIDPAAFKTDVLRIIGYSLLFGVLAGLLIGIW